MHLAHVANIALVAKTALVANSFLQLASTISAHWIASTEPIVATQSSRYQPYQAP